MKAAKFSVGDKVTIVKEFENEQYGNGDEGEILEEVDGVFPSGTLYKVVFKNQKNEYLYENRVFDFEMELSAIMHSPLYKALR